MIVEMKRSLKKLAHVSTVAVVLGAAASASTAETESVAEGMP